MARGSQYYRGRRRGMRPLMICVLVLAALVLLSMFVFRYFQRYLVYTPNGVSLEPPFLHRNEQVIPETDSSGQPVNGTVVFDTPSYADTPQRDISGLSAVHALYVPAQDVSDVGLSLAASNLGPIGADAMLLQMKGPDGRLAWNSSVALARSYGAAAAYDPTESLAALKARGVYLAAEVCCCTDALMAGRNLPLALKNADGDAYTDAAGVWLDPINGQVRDYLTALCRELAAMGFDEIVLTGVAFPQDAAAVHFSQAMSYTPEPTATVSSLAGALTAALADSGVRVSVQCGAETLMSGAPGVSGQDPVLFFRLFDRVYAPTTWETAQCRTAVAAYPIAGDAAIRFVPVSAYGLTEGSWVCRPEA